MKMLDLDWVGGASPPLRRAVNFVGDNVQQGCVDGTANGGGDIRVAKEDIAQD